MSAAIFDRACAILEGMVDSAWAVLSTGLVHGTVLVMIALALSATALRRASPAFMTALWTVVLIKFAVPVGPDVPLSMSALVSAVMSAAEPGPAAAHGSGEGVAAAAGARSGAELAWLLAQLGLLAGYLALVARRLRRHIRSHRGQRRRAEMLPVADRAIAAVARRAAAAVGVRRLPAVRVCDRPAAPELIGLYRPLLVVPRHLCRDLPRLQAALLHELAHVRRRDAWLRAVQIAVATLFFFWPVVAWVNRRIDDHREMACDQWALARGTMTARDYARTLVALARCARVSPAESAAPGAALGIVSGMRRKQLEARVESLLSRRARPRMGLMSGGGLALWALVSLGGADPATADLARAPECVIEPGVMEYILATFPDADLDGNGELSRDEVCAHQRRLKEMRDSAGEALGAPDAPELDAVGTREIAWLECAACGECDSDDAYSSEISAEVRMCSAESGAR